MDKILSLISTTTDLTKALSDVELVIEAVFEDMDVKKELFKKMDGICPERNHSGKQYLHLEHYRDGGSHCPTGKVYRNTFLNSGSPDSTR